MPTETNKPVRSINESFEIRKGLTNHNNSALACMRVTKNDSSSNQNNQNQK